MDLYWFQKEENTVAKLFDRLEGFWHGDCVKGISLCVGWLYDLILYFNNDVDMKLPTCQAPKYDSWTYQKLSKKITEIKEEASTRGISDFKVVILIMGIETQSFDEENTCDGWGGRTDETTEKHHYTIEGKWFYEHHEVRDERFHPFYFGSDLQIDNNRLKFGDYFCDKLEAFTKAVGVDGIVFRDHVFSPAYIRGGRYMPEHDATEWTDSFINLFREIKRRLNDFLIIGYGSGTSSMEELRSFGFDLERVAQSGFLDIWITQTWASAWQDYWPAHSMGYTFQLQNALANLTMLSGTNCKHLFLIETFDAWEPWDSIHQFPQKVKWEIWAYSHLCTKSKKGMRHSDGYYISWMHKGYELLTEQTIRHITDTLYRAYTDVEEKISPVGFTVLYDRESLIQRQPYLCGENWDDWCSMLVKCGLSVMSSVRSECFNESDCGAYIVPALCENNRQFISQLIERINSGVKFVFIGVAELLPDDLKNFLELETKIQLNKCIPICAEYNGVGLTIHQCVQSLVENENVISIIKAGGVPIFAKHKRYNCYFWEPPIWNTPEQLHLTYRSIGSPELYHIIAKECKNEDFYWENYDTQQPVCCLTWKYETDNDISVLLGNLETGIMGNSQFGVKGQLNGEISEAETPVSDFKPGKISLVDNGVQVALAFHKAGIVKIKYKKKGKGVTSSASHKK